MANMIPDTPVDKSEGGAKAERVVFDALRHQLNDEFFVYSRLQYIDDKKYTAGEADFLILHRTMGMLFLECKGYGVEKNAGGQWRRRVHGHWEHMHEGPFEQAERTRYEFVDKLKPRIKRILPLVKEFPFIHGHGVVFPFARIDKFNLPLDEPRTLFIDCDDLDNLNVKITEIFELWADKVKHRIPRLKESQFKTFRKKILHPKLNIADSVAGHIKADARVMLRLTQRQVMLIDSLLGNRRLLVKGGAGTGKTVLAFEAARRLADMGKSVAVLCYNKALGEHLRELVLPDEQIAVNSFSALNAIAFFKINRDRELPVPLDKEAKDLFWREEAPLYLLEAVEAGVLPRYDAIVVDEAQDFDSSWWTVIEEMLKSDKSQIFAFYDPLQDIFDRKGLMPDWVSVDLNINFRNTVQITAVLNSLGTSHMKNFTGCPVGESPVVYEQKNRNSTLAELERILRELIDDEHLYPDQITVLTPHSREHSTFAGIDYLGPFQLAFEPSDRDHRVLHTTIGKFKGLESDVIILVDIDPADPRSGVKARYVGASRARHMLYIFSKGNWLATD
jgi:hypothetical protein